MMVHLLFQTLPCLTGSIIVSPYKFVDTFTFIIECNKGFEFNFICTGKLTTDSWDEAGSTSEAAATFLEFLPIAEVCRRGV